MVKGCDRRPGGFLSVGEIYRGEAVLTFGSNVF